MINILIFLLFDFSGKLDYLGNILRYWENVDEIQHDLDFIVSFQIVVPSQSCAWFGNNVLALALAFQITSSHI